MESPEQISSPADEDNDDINMTELLQRVGGDQELARLILAELKNDLPLQIMLLHSHIDNQDAAAARQAHKMRGAIANIGAKKTCRLLSEVETLGRDGDPVGQRQAYRRLQPQLDALLTAITAALKREH